MKEDKSPGNYTYAPDSTTAPEYSISPPAPPYLVLEEEEKIELCPICRDGLKKRSEFSYTCVSCSLIFDKVHLETAARTRYHYIQEALELHGVKEHGKCSGTGRESVDA